MNTDIDWNTVKFRASSWGNLLAEPQSKADKDAGRLGVTCQKELIKIYNQVKYGRKKEIVTKQMEKGKLAEEDSITLYSRVEKKLYLKNEEQLENEWFCGHPDIFIGDNILNAEEVSDIKTSWSLDTFMPTLIEEPDRGYVAQLNVYFSLTGAQCGAIVYCLVDCPVSILFEESEWLLRKGSFISKESPDYLLAWEELQQNLVFPDIDYRERVIKQPVERDDVLIEKMKMKVPIFRKWLAEFEEKHMNQYKKLNNAYK